MTGAADVRWLVETSIMVDVLRGSESARSWVDSVPRGCRHISVVTAAELYSGCRNRLEQRKVSRELVLYKTLWIDEAISMRALSLYEGHHLSHGVGFLDCIISATAELHALSLATLNLKHFRALPGLVLTKPY